MLFYVFGGLAIVSALGVIGQRNPIYSVLALVLMFASLAGLYVVLDAPFTAVTQIIIYAGAIMVLFLFVVMLLNNPLEGHSPYDRSHPLRRTAAGRMGGVLAVMLVAELAWGLSRMVGAGAPVAGDVAAGAVVSSVREIGVKIFTDYRFAFEATSILILVAMIGAVVLARREEATR